MLQIKKLKLGNKLTSLTSVCVCVDTGLGAVAGCLELPEGCVCHWLQTSCTLLCTARALPNSGLSNRVCTAAIWPSRLVYPPAPWLKPFFFSWCCNRCRDATSSPYPVTTSYTYLKKQSISKFLSTGNFFAVISSYFVLCGPLCNIV
jgi:hypothetical protein